MKMSLSAGRPTVGEVDLGALEFNYRQIQKRIPGGVDPFFRFRLTPVLFRKDSLKLLSREAEKRRKKVKVHVKVDTGMGRLGVPFNLWADFLKEVKRFPNIEVEGLLSHFSMTDQEKNYTHTQWRAFQRAVRMAKEMGLSCPYLH